MQTRPWFILSSERVLEEGSQNPYQLQGEKKRQLEKFSPEEDRTHNTALSRTASPTHNQGAIAVPVWAFPRAVVATDRESDQSTKLSS